MYDIQAQIAKALADKEPVVIYENTEAGIRQWSVSVVNDPGFWLDAFSTRQKAERYCQDHELPVRRVAAMTHPSMDYEDVMEDIELDTFTDF